MSFHNKKHFDDDDDDLESLRLAALKSLAPKKDNTSPLNGGNAIEVLENGPLTRNISTVRPINTLDNANLHVRLDVAEPYVPQSVQNVGHVDWNYTAFMGNVHAKPNVIPTLSPRSLAFVEQNNDILMRRKGEKSTRSTSPYRDDLRWSESPPPLHKRRSPSFRKSLSRTVSRSPVQNTRFSKSPHVIKSPRRTVKSPVRNVRPLKKRSKSRTGRNSRSPMRRGDSLSRIHPERRRSASLYSNQQNKFNRNPPKANDRLTPPPVRHRRSSRSQSPIHNTRNKSITPPPQPHRNNRKRSRSPFQPHVKRSRSNSRSPHRKVRQRSREYGGGYGKGNNNKHYSNKNIEFNRKYLSQNNYSNRNNKYHNNNSKYNNKYENRREPQRSPAKYRSKSKSPPIHNNSENGSKLESKKEGHNKYGENSCNKVDNNKDVSSNAIEHDKLSTTDDDDQNSTENDDNNDEDEIDLFASEESESETEGRFKSSSKNTDSKKIATLSYSKLSEAAAVCVSELKDMSTATSNWNDTNNRDYGRRNNGDRERDRDRDRDRKGSRRGGGDDNWKSSMSRRNRTKEDDNDNRSGKKTEKSNNSNNSGNSNGMKMFRSTFQAVDDNNLNSKSSKENTSSKPNDDKSSNKNTTEANTEPRNVVHLKRSIMPTKQADKEATDEASKNLESSVSSESAGGKKPIHLRLGAISNSSKSGGTGSGSQSQTGKPNPSWKSKKSWRTEKVSINIYL